MAEKPSTEILQTAMDAQKDRAATRDLPDGERSIKRCVEAFNALEGTNLTPAQGWRFMVVLKLARATAGTFNVDDYVDGASYFALAGEEAAKEPRKPMTAEEYVEWLQQQVGKALGDDSAEEAATMTLALSHGDAEQLLRILDEYDDQGPLGEGYKSDELQEFIGKIEAQFDPQ